MKFYLVRHRQTYTNVLACHSDWAARAFHGTICVMERFFCEHTAQKNSFCFVENDDLH